MPHETNSTAAPTQQHDVEDMIDNPARYGFIWQYGPLSKEKYDYTVQAPYRKSVDLTLLRETFGDAPILRALDGQSFKVGDQTIREALFADGGRDFAKDDRGMKRWILEKALGIRARAPRVTEVRVPVFVAMDRSEHPTFEAMAAHNMALAVDAKQQ